MAVFQKETEINKSVTCVFDFLSNLNNHEQLMPDNVYNWSSTENEANMTIKNMAKLSLIIAKSETDEYIEILPTNELPFSIKLSWTIKKISEEVSNVRFCIDADLNMMMKLVASGPLQKLVDYQVQKLKETLT